MMTFKNPLMGTAPFVGVAFLGTTTLVADDITYVGLDCPTDTVSVLEEVWSSETAPGASDTVLFGSGGQARVAVGTLGREGTDCPTLIFSVDWTVAGIQCVGGPYDLLFDPTDVASGQALDPAFVHVQTVDVGTADAPGDLRCFGGWVIAAEAINIHNGACAMHGTKPTGPINLGAGNAALQLDAAGQIDQHPIQFGGHDGVDHAVEIRNNTLVVWTTHLTLDGDDADVSLVIEDAQAFFYQGLSLDGTNTNYLVDLSGNSFLSHTGSLTSDDSTAHFRLVDTSDALVLGTFELGAGDSLELTGTTAPDGAEPPVKFDADFLYFLAGANAEIRNAVLISFAGVAKIYAGAVVRAAQDAVLQGNYDVTGELILEEGAEATGTLAVDGTLRADDATVGELVMNSGGLLDWSNEVAVDDDLVASSASIIFDCLIDRTPGPSGIGHLVVGGTAQLNGSLQPSLNGSVGAGEQFAIIDAAAVTGEFASVADGWSVIYEPTSVTLVADRDMTGGETTPGDATGDGVVDVLDLLAVLGAWGDCADPGDCPEDLDGDGAVAVGDLLEVLGNWTS